MSYTRCSALPVCRSAEPAHLPNAPSRRLRSNPAPLPPDTTHGSTLRRPPLAAHLPRGRVPQCQPRRVPPPPAPRGRPGRAGPWRGRAGAAPGAGAGRGGRRGCATPDTQVRFACAGSAATAGPGLSGTGRPLAPNVLLAARHRAGALFSLKRYCGASFLPSLEPPPVLRQAPAGAARSLSADAQRGAPGPRWMLPVRAAFRAAEPRWGGEVPAGAIRDRPGAAAAAPCAGTKRLKPSSAGGGGLGPAGRRPAVPAPRRAARFKAEPWRSRAWAWPP